VINDSGYPGRRVKIIFPLGLRAREPTLKEIHKEGGTLLEGVDKNDLDGPFDTYEKGKKWAETIFKEVEVRPCGSCKPHIPAT
jgi:hypothetical protein